MSSSHTSLKSPLHKARGLGSAKDGVHHWWMQRMTAVAMLPLSLYLLCHIDTFVSGSYIGFSGWISEPLPAIAMILFIIASFYHAALGVQVIIEDYIHGEGTKVLCLMLNKLIFIALMITAIFAVIAINLGFYNT